MTDHLSLDRDRCLSELAYCVSRMLGVPPITATAICEHVFQSLVEHFYENGAAYFPNFGWIVFSQGELLFTPCDALEQTSAKLSVAIESRAFSFANIESVLEAARRANAIQAAEKH